MVELAASFVFILGCLCDEESVSTSIQLLAVVIAGFTAGTGTAVGGHFAASVEPVSQQLFSVTFR